MITTLAILWGLENALLAAVALKKIRRSPNRLIFIYPIAFVNGAFVWEDMLIFGVFHFLSVVIGLLLTDLRYTILFFLLFWIIRSSGETLYFFLQQVIRPTHHPHNISAHFKPLRTIFGNISDQKCFILLQVFLQTILVISLFGLTIFLMQWNLIKPIYP